MRRRDKARMCGEWAVWQALSLAVVIALGSALASSTIYMHYTWPHSNLLGWVLAVSIPCALCTTVFAALAPSRRWSAGAWLSAFLVFVAFGVALFDTLRVGLSGLGGYPPFIGSPLAVSSVALASCWLGLAVVRATDGFGKRMAPAGILLSLCAVVIVVGAVYARVQSVQLRHKITAEITPLIEGKLAPFVFGTPQHIIWDRTYTDYDETRFWGRIYGTKAWVCAWVSHNDPRWPIARADQWWRFEQMDFWVPQPTLTSESRVTALTMLRSIGIHSAFARKLRPGNKSAYWELSAVQGPIFYGVDLDQNPAYSFGEDGTPINGWYAQIRVSRQDSQPLLPMEARMD